MPPIKRDRYIWFVYSGSNGFAGKLTPLGVFEIATHDNNGTAFAWYVDKTTGKTTSDFGPLNNVGVVTSIIAAAQYKGIEITEVVEGEILEQNTEVANWEDYEILD